MKEIGENDSNLSLLTTGKDITKRASNNVEAENQVGNNEEIDVSEIQAQSNHEEDNSALDEYRRGSMFSKQSFWGSRTNDVYSSLCSKGNKNKKKKSKFI